MSEETPHWRRNMYVCLFGSFTNITAMTLLLPFLPIYVEQLGVKDHAAIVQWSGIAYGIAFLGGRASSAPIWGKMADLYGRKLILMRACLAMAICMSVIGMAQEYLATRRAAPAGRAARRVRVRRRRAGRDRRRRRNAQAGRSAHCRPAAWRARLLGPLIGGVLPRADRPAAKRSFWAGGVIFVAFVATYFLYQRGPGELASKARAEAMRGAWSMIPDRRPVIAMLVTAMLLMLANMSIEPIITVYVGATGAGRAQVVFTSGLVMAASAVGSVLAAPGWGGWPTGSGRGT